MRLVTIQRITTIRFVRTTRRATDLIRVTVDRIRTVNTQIVTARTRITEIRTRIDVLRTTTITQAWQQTAEGAIFVQRMLQCSQDLMRMTDLFGRMTTVLTQSADGFLQTQTTVKNIASNLGTPIRR